MKRANVLQEVRQRRIEKLYAWREQRTVTMAEGEQDRQLGRPSRRFPRRIPYGLWCGRPNLAPSSSQESARTSLISCVCKTSRLWPKTTPSTIIASAYRSFRTHNGSMMSRSRCRRVYFMICLTASTIDRAPMPKWSMSSSGFPLCGIVRTASLCTLMPSGPTALSTASPRPPCA